MIDGVVFIRPHRSTTLNIRENITQILNTKFYCRIFFHCQGLNYVYVSYRIGTVGAGGCL